MRAVALIVALAAGCGFDSHSFPDEPDEVELVPDAGAGAVDAAGGAVDAEATMPAPDAETATPPDIDCETDDDCPPDQDCTPDGLCDREHHDEGEEGGSGPF